MSFPKILTWKLRKSSFWPLNMGVDSYTRLTNTEVNTVINLNLPCDKLIQ